MPSRDIGWAVETVNALPEDGNRYEVIDGELLVSPAPPFLHQHAIGALFLQLAPYACTLGLDVLMAPAAVTFSERREVQPDLFVLPRNGGQRAARFADVGRLLLVVEVLFPSSERSDRYAKRALYQEEQVPEYWIIDVEQRAAEQWHQASVKAEVRRNDLHWQPVTSMPALRIDLPDYFRDVHGIR